MIEESEAIALILGLIAAPIAIRLFRSGALPGRALAGFGFLLGSYVLTIAEGFVFPDLLNALEHLCQAAAGVAFALAVWRLGRGRGGAGAT